MALLKSASDRDGGGGRGISDSGGMKSPVTTKLGLWIFMGVVTMLFSLLMLAYIMRMQYPDWKPMPDPWQLWPNTAMLMLSSIALQWAHTNARRGRVDRLKIGLLAGGVLALGFVAGQLWAWQYLKSLNYFVTDNPAISFFYLITGLHGLHLLGGMVALGWAAAKVYRGIEARLSVELCARYWHFLFVVWVLLFGLLLFADLGPRNWIPMIC